MSSKRSGIVIKGISGIILLLLFSSCNAPKPVDSLILKIGFLPGKKYELSTERNSSITIQYFGSEKPLKKLKEMGIRNPNLITKKFSTHAVLSTEQLSGDGSFRVALNVMKPSGLEVDTEIPNDLNFKGTCQLGKLPEFDIVETAERDFPEKRKLLETVENTFFQFSFQEKSLKIGDQFSIEKPLSMRMEGSTVEMLVVTNYRLAEINKGVAKFELSQNYEMNQKIMNNSFKGTGKGDGAMEYDVDKMLILNYNLNNEMELVKKLDNFEFVLKSKSSFLQINKLTVN